MQDLRQTRDTTCVRDQWKSVAFCHRRKGPISYGDLTEILLLPPLVLLLENDDKRRWWSRQSRSTIPWGWLRWLTFPWHNKELDRVNPNDKMSCEWLTRNMSSTSSGALSSLSIAYLFSSSSSLFRHPRDSRTWNPCERVNDTVRMMTVPRQETCVPADRHRKQSGILWHTPDIRQILNNSITGLIRVVVIGWHVTLHGFWYF